MGTESAIARPALGHSASLGSLYDARRDEFCGTSIFKLSIPSELLTLVDNKHSDIQMSYEDNVSDKFRNLNVNGDLQVSLLAGMVGVGGSGSFLIEIKESARSVKCSIIYNIRTKHESINLYHQDLKDAFAVESVQNGMATHVVVGIDWGANLILSCTHENCEGKNAKEIKGKLSRELVAIIKSIKGEAEYITSNAETGIKFDFRVYGDILAPINENLPTTFEEAYKLMQKLPALIADSNDGKGKPLSYKLVPISIVQDYLQITRRENCFLQTLNKAILTRVVIFFDQMSIARQKFNDFYQDTKDFKNCIDAKTHFEISQIDDKLTEYESEVRSQLSEELLRARSENKATHHNFNLEKLLEKFRKDEHSPQRIRRKLDSFINLAEKIKFIRQLSAKGAKYIGLDTDIDKELLEHQEDKSIILYYSKNCKDKDDAEWKENRQLFFQELSKNDISCHYYVVDCDLHPDQKSNAHFSSVKIVQNGKILIENMLELERKLANIALVQTISGSVTEQLLRKPNKRIPFITPCTGTRCNPKTTYEWTCKKCCTKIEYGEDNHVYCNCGKTNVACLEFKCTDLAHGFVYDRHNKDFMAQILPSLRPFDETNILILGKTGVGKSTFINGFANFVAYDSLEIAEAGELCSLIPTQFTVLDEDYKQTVVTCGFSPDEVSSAGHSATQKSKVHEIVMERRTIRLIDTPGIGDTRGIEQDKKNFQNILNTLSKFKEIHGICILLKPNDSRLDVMFRFCIKELLTYLHRDASRNIVFYFTNSRGTFYRPGETYPALQTLLSENKEVEIPLNRNTMYCFDSEAYRFLAAIKNDPPITFSEDDRRNFAASWKISLAEIKKMLSHIHNLEPHQIDKTLNLNRTREMILKLARPLADITRNIQINKQVVKREMEEISMTDENIDKLKKRLKITRLELESRKIDYPKTVCTNATCKKVWQLNGLYQIQYITLCHERCFLKNVPADTRGDPALMFCLAFCGNNDICRNCKHHYTEHLHVYYDSFEVVKEYDDPAVVESLKKNVSAKKNEREYD